MIDAMADLNKKFQQAQDKINNLDDRPDNATSLRLYALYKQATMGDASGGRPPAMDMIRRAKYDAWAAVKGMSTDDAMQEYIDLADSIEG
jgi:diazepam-binding inhibitor (GABA receptor modulator, acyl-CoA-binding protein)